MIGTWFSRRLRSLIPSPFTRFFTYKKTLTDEELRRTTDVNFDRVVALIATAGDGDAAQLFGGGRYAINDESNRQRVQKSHSSRAMDAAALEWRPSPDTSCPNRQERTSYGSRRRS